MTAALVIPEQVRMTSMMSEMRNIEPEDGYGAST